MPKRIPISEDTYAALKALKDEEETFDELLSRFIREREVRAGAGLWADTDAAEHARARRSELKADVGMR